MAETETSSVFKNTLKRICHNYKWSYGVFWSFDQINSMLLTLKDICYEEQVAMVADDMLQQGHMLGEGVIGIAAFTGKHQWIFSDSFIGERNSSLFLGSLDIFQDSSEFQQQFSCGIKTIAVIPVNPHGVIQLGSTLKIFESFEFLVDTKRLICQVINAGGLVPQKNTSMASSTDVCHFDDEVLTSLVSSGNSDDWSLSAMHNNSRRDTVGKSCASMDSNLLHCTDSFDKPAFDISSFSKSSCETSVVTSSEPLPTFDIRDQDAQYPSYLDGSFLESHYNLKRSSTCQSMTGGTDIFHMDNVQLSPQLLSVAEGELMDSVTSLPNFHEGYLSEDFTIDLPDISMVDDLFQWFESSPEHRIEGASTALNDNLSQTEGVSGVSSNLVEVDKHADNPNKNPVVSSQSSVTLVSQSHSNGQDKTGIVHRATDDLLHSLGLDFGCGLAGKSQGAVVIEPHSSYSGGSNGVPAFTSKLAEASSDLPRKRLFWELGIEELLDGHSNSSSSTKSAVENQLSASKRTKMERLPLNSSQVRLSGPYTGMNLIQSSGSMIDKIDHSLFKKEVVPKPQISSWIDDSYSTNIGGSILGQSHKGAEPAKIGKKRARPGESNRPRPKDRQQIQDRIKELRGIIPSGGKCSIDSLLDRTIKYMLFLQSVTKYADKLKQANKPKLIDQENGVVLNEKCTMDRGGGGVTWAFKVGATPMVCPVIVEDLSSPGQMLVEMLCEERGFFLEIADMIRSYGLTILKGVMEIREDKIWAQFVVEVKLNTNQSITRINVFLSLMELIQQTNTGGTELANQSSNVVDGGVSLLDCLQNPTLQIPISLAETLQ